MVTPGWFARRQRTLQRNGAQLALCEKSAPSFSELSLLSSPSHARKRWDNQQNSMKFNGVQGSSRGPWGGGEESIITRNYLRPGRPSDLEISSRERSAPGRAGQRPGRTRQDIHGVLNHPPLHELLGARDPKAGASAARSPLLTAAALPDSAALCLRAPILVQDFGCLLLFAALCCA